MSEMATHPQLIFLIGKMNGTLGECNFADYVANIPSRLRIRMVPKGRSAVFALPSHGQIAH